MTTITKIIIIHSIPFMNAIKINLQSPLINKYSKSPPEYFALRMHRF